MTTNAGATAAIAALVNAIKASGIFISVTEEDFMAVLRRMEAPLVVHAEGGFLKKKHKYITSYKGLAFYTKVDQPLYLPRGTEVIEARKIWVPEM